MKKKKEQYDIDTYVLSRLFATRAAAHQVPLSIEFSRQEYGVGCHVFLQGLFQTQEPNWNLLHFWHWQVHSLQLHHLGSPVISIYWLKFPIVVTWEKPSFV